MKLTESEIRTLPLPSPAQHREFVNHLKDAHSWYKHLSLIDGGKFIIFLNPNAGAGYPSQHLSLPSGNTVEGYRQAFGYLDYMYSIDGGAFDRDCGGVDKPDLELPTELLEKCSFILYPYVSSEFYWCDHEADVVSLQAGTSHRERSHLLAWYAASQAVESAESNEEVSKQIRRIEAYNLAGSLQIQEVMRIEYYLRQLYEWHSPAASKTLVDLLQNSPLLNHELKSAAMRSDREI